MSILRTPFVFTAALSLLAAMPGCKKDATQAPTTIASPTTGTADTVSCASDGRVSQYTANMKVQGNSHNLTFVITQATPTPPAGGKNTWNVQVLTQAGAPSSAYTLTATPYMPDHAHGPATAPVVAAQNGTYVISNIDFFMGGVWRTTLTAKDAQGNIVDAANVFFCVPG